MNIHTGVYVPGTAFYNSDVERVVAAQRLAIVKGAYRDAEGVKQRVIIVDNEVAKKELKKHLLDPSAYGPVLIRVFNGVNFYPCSMAELGKQLAVSDRIVTLAERKKNAISLKKLYIDANSSEVGSTQYTTGVHKQPTFNVASVAGLSMGVLACAIAGSSTGVAVAAGLVTFLGRAIYQESQPERKTIESNWQELCRVFDKYDLYCRDIRILTDESGDRAAVADIESASDRRTARTNPGGVRALDEQLADCLRSSPRKGMYETVSGYQGLGGYGYINSGKHLIRWSSRASEDQPFKYTFVRQKHARVMTRV